MFAGFYTAASGVLSQQRTLNVLSNNIVNAKTPGYRAERVVSGTFDFELLTRMEAGKAIQIGAGSPIRLIQEVPVNFDSNAQEETGRLLDVAIGGMGFFNVQEPLPEDTQEEPQVYLTRNGGFTVDAEGYLSLEGVGRVLGQKGEIRVEGSDFIIQEDGTVYNARGRWVDQLLITWPQELTQLNKATNGLYTIDEPENNLTVENSKLYQGMLERSNIDVNRELTLAMEAQRTFQSCSQALKILDTMNQRAASEIAAL